MITWFVEQLNCMLYFKTCLQISAFVEVVSSRQDVPSVELYLMRLLKQHHEDCITSMHKCISDWNSLKTMFWWVQNHLRLGLGTGIFTGISPQNRYFAPVYRSTQCCSDLLSLSSYINGQSQEFDFYARFRGLLVARPRAYWQER